MKYFLLVFAVFHMAQAASAVNLKYVGHDTQAKTDAEFDNFAKSVQDKQFEITRSTPFPGDLMEGEFKIYFSTSNQHPILYLRAGTSTYIFRSEPYFK